MQYTVQYKAQNIYETAADEALWQFLIIPEENNEQRLLSAIFTNSLNIPVETSINGYGYTTYRVHPRTTFHEIHFEATFLVEKEKINPFERIEESPIDNELLTDLAFRTQHEPFLRQTGLTTLPKEHTSIYTFEKSVSIFENLQKLNSWIHSNFRFRTDVTDVDTDIGHIIETRHGVCQDFTHLFCAIARKNGIPCRYVSGYINQGSGFTGDAQMHAWVECYLPKSGWIGFDPTNNILAVEDHITVAHGKDYTDCPPIKGVVYTAGKNTTRYSVAVDRNKNTQEQQQQQ